MSRLFIVLTLLLGLFIPTPAQGNCRQAASRAAELLVQARSALTEGDADYADALIAAAYDALAEGCPTVEPETSDQNGSSEGDPPAADTTAGDFAINAPGVSIEQSLFFVQVAHTGVDAGPLDIYTRASGSMPLVENLAFGDVTGLITLPAGDHSFVVRRAGSGASGEVLYTLHWNFVGNSTWMVTAAGIVETLAFITEPINIIRTRLDGRARVRVVNWVSGERLSVSSDRNVSFGDGLGWVGIKDAEVEPGDYALRVTGEDGSELANAALTLAPDTVYTLLLAGMAGGEPPVRVIVIEAPQDQTRVRFVNRRDDAVDIHMRPGSERLVERLEPGAETEFYVLPSGAATFVAYAPGEAPRGQEKAALAEQLRPGRDLTVTLRGNGAMTITERGLTPR